MSWADTNLAPGPMPLWAQIAARLRNDIQAGAFQPGHTVPGEADLNRRFGVSRTTARAALNALETEGLITRQSGRGSIVLPPPIKRPLNRLSSFHEDMRARGLQPSTRTESVRSVAAPDWLATELAVSPNTPLVTFDRLLCADDCPIATSATWLAPFVSEHSPALTVAELDSGSFYQWLEERAGVQLAGGREVVAAIPADAATAKLLNVAPGTPVLEIRRVSHDTANRPVEFVLLHYRADRYRLHVTMVRE